MHAIDVKSPASTRHGPKKTYSSKKGLKNKWTPTSTLKTILGRVDACKTWKPSILKYSTKKNES
jgi:hypothetical protein